MKENELKEKRYLCILLLMYAYVNPSELEKLKSRRTDTNTFEELRNELQTE